MVGRVRGVGVGVGLFPTRSMWIKTDQRGSRWNNGDQCDLWVGIRGVGMGRGVSNQIKADQGQIKADQRSL